MRKVNFFLHVFDFLADPGNSTENIFNNIFSNSTPNFHISIEGIFGWHLKVDFIDFCELRNWNWSLFELISTDRKEMKSCLTPDILLQIITGIFVVMAVDVIMVVKVSDSFNDTTEKNLMIAVLNISSLGFGPIG